MGFDCAKMTEAYLSLWKLLDMRRPDHHWLELTSVSEDELKSEISRMARQRLPWAGHEEQELKQDIKIALESLQAAVTPESAKRLDQLRNSFQEKALGYAAQTSERKVTDVARDLMANVRTSKAQDLMHPGVETIEESATVSEALKKMKQKQVSSLLVQRRDPSDAWGIVTKKDIVTKVIDPGPSRRNLSTTKVHEIMSKPLVTVSPGLAIKYCVRLMCKAGVTRAPVFDGKEPIGILSFTDIFKTA